MDLHAQHGHAGEDVLTGGARRSVRAFLGTVALNIAALGGAICIVLVIVAISLNITLIMFKTGSMSPTIPTGSAALVREIPAADVAIGDVVTVDRLGQLPVTHRVTRIEGTGDLRTITLKGDANRSEDPAPYQVERVRVVLASVPKLAYAIVWLSNAWVLGTITLAGSSLVTWAFWPRSPRRPRERIPAVGDQPRTAGGPRHVLRRTRRSRWRWAWGAVAIGVLVGVGSAVTAPGDAASAEPREQVVRGSHLVLTSFDDPQRMRQLAPGSSAVWELSVAAEVDEPGTITVRWSGSGRAELGLTMTVDSCSMRWQGAVCPGDVVPLIADREIPVDEVPRPLMAFTTDVVEWIRFEVAMPDTSNAADAPVTLTAFVEGAGDSLTVSPGGGSTLPDTGSGLRRAALWAALVALAVGMAVAVAGRPGPTRVGP